MRHLEVNGRVYDMRKGAFVGDAIYGVDVGEYVIYGVVWYICMVYGMDVSELLTLD